MSAIYLDILDKNRQAVWTRLKAFSNNGYLAGGTALALQLNHRISVDFDIFLSQPIKTAFFRKVRQIFGENIEPRINTEDLLLVKLENKIEVHFVNYWYKRLKETIETDSIALASIKDIAADKAHTIGRRGMWRDYVDIFYILKKNIIDIQTLINLARQKFNGEFAGHLFLQQLTYFEDIHDFTIELIEDNYSVDEIKNYLVDQVTNYTKETIENNG